MKFFISHYRDFDPKLWVYMARSFDSANKIDAMPGMGIGEVSDKYKKEYGKEKRPAYFARQKEQAEKIIRHINLDNNKDIKTQKERDLENQLLDNNDEEFRKLRENYYVQLRELGKDSKDMKEKVAEFQTKLSQYISYLAKRVERLNIQNGNSDALGAMVDRLILKKLPVGYQALKGLGKYIVESNFGYFRNLKLDGKSVTDMKAEVLKLVDRPDVLRAAVDHMLLKLPRVSIYGYETEYFQERFKATDKNPRERLTSTFGNQYERRQAAAHALALRFHIVFKKDGKTPEYIVDLRENNKVYYPGDAWNQKLHNVCQSFKDTPDMDKSNKQMATIKKGHLEKWQALIAGMHGGKRLDNLKSLRHNKHLVQLLDEVKKYDTDVNTPLRVMTHQFRRLSNRSNLPPVVGTALDRFNQQLTPELIRTSGMTTHLGSLLSMIKDLFSSNQKPEDKVWKLKQMMKGLREGGDVTHEYRHQMAYEKVLKHKKPSLVAMIRLLYDKKFRDAYFSKNSKSLNIDKSLYTYDNFVKYGKPSIKKIARAYLPWLKNKLKLTGEPMMGWDTKEGKMQVSLKTKEGTFDFFVEQQANSHFQIFRQYNKAPLLKNGGIRPFSEALLAAIHKEDALVRKESEPRVRRRNIYASALIQMENQSYKPGYESFLETLVKKIEPSRSLKGEYPQWNPPAASSAEAMQEYYRDFQEKCSSFIASNMPAYLPFIQQMVKSDPDFGNIVLSLGIDKPFYEKSIESMIQKKWISGPTDLAKIIKMNPQFAKEFKRPKWNSADRNASQLTLDKARAQFIMKYFMEYQPYIYRYATDHPNTAFAKIILNKKAQEFAQVLTGDRKLKKPLA